ncbi:MAG: hypothetical protein K2L69_08975 [Muribaculaceae bacterium]|nr:hypothetical protein [Muribaculaceae bacterium]MDE6344857.1 hypothetical protein [Muribaculaceae bacterium]MDE6609882.1 hypothetical protein [Muribaculaceae bacterium]
MMRYLQLICLVSFLCITEMSAQSLKVDNEILRWEAGASAGLNNDGYQIDLSAAWFPLQYVGARMTLGFAGEIEEIGDWGNDDWDSADDYAIRIKLIPALVLRSPRLVNWKSQSGGFYLFAEPGFVLAPGAAGSRNARIFNVDLKTGINLQLERVVLSLGYGITDFSLYSGRPINHHGLPDRDNYITHSVFIAAAYKF